MLMSRNLRKDDQTKKISFRFINLFPNTLKGILAWVKFPSKLVDGSYLRLLKIISKDSLLRLILSLYEYLTIISAFKESYWNLFLVSFFNRVENVKIAIAPCTGSTWLQAIIMKMKLSRRQNYSKRYDDLKVLVLE